MSETHLNLSGDASVQLHDIPFGTTHLDISNCGLTSLHGLPLSIRHLRCSKNKLTTLEEISHIPLESLGCSYNHLSNLKGCPPTVTTLVCVSNFLTDLEGLPASLEKLYCSYNLLKRMPYANITILDCSCNQIGSLEGMGHVTELICSNNRLSSLKGCSESVEILRCSDNPLTDFSYLPQRLSVLECLKVNVPISTVKKWQSQIKEVFCDDLRGEILHK